jgi:uncharacterized membrane protein
LLLLAPKDPGDATGADLVNADGKVVVGRIAPADKFFNNLVLTNPFIWSAERGIQTMGPYPGTTTSTVAEAISADGTTVVGDSSRPQPFEWTTAGYAPFVGLDSIEDASADLTVAVGYAGGAAARWANGATTPLVDPTAPTVQLSPVAVSADGSTVVGSMASQAFVWKGGNVTAISNVANAGSGTATNVSADGTVVIGFSYDDVRLPRAFRWTATGGAKKIGAFRPTACSGDGSVIVGIVRVDPTIDTSARVGIWDEAHGTRDLAAVLAGAGVDLAGVRLDEVNDISADGHVIVGRAFSADHKTVAFRAVLPGLDTAPMDASGDDHVPDHGCTPAVASDECGGIGWSCAPQHSCCVGYGGSDCRAPVLTPDAGIVGSDMPCKADDACPASEYCQDGARCCPVGYDCSPPVRGSK